ncbi:MAG: glutamate--tRNA ligase [Anaerolineae bacterium]|nr:glutamate--tRNA ligase [Anaerolineae bacterium]
MTPAPVRVRFAPSPTGFLHIGGARTALLNWLFARHSGGSFILRIEDTDRNRLTAGAVEGLMDALRWLGLEWDEGPDKGGPHGPYVQSERKALYHAWANGLLEQGKAYKCWATPEELQRAREIAQKSRGGKIAGYERIYRFISDAERAQVQAERGDAYVIRFAMPLEGETVVHDRVRGKIVFDNADQSDTVLLKSDGFPTYHLAMAVDDHFMQISHVMRSDEWVPSLALHQQLYEAFGWPAPEWVHLPVILNPTGKGKLSKRKPPVDEKGNPIPVMVHEYRELGYLPEALVNFLTNIGYSFGDDREVFTVEETIGRFDLRRINPASGTFPMQKLIWLNGKYIADLTDEDFITRVTPFLQAAYGERFEAASLHAITPFIKERVNPLMQAVALIKFLYVYDPSPAEELIMKKMDAAQTSTILERSHALLSTIEPFVHTATEPPMRDLVEALGFKPGQVFGTLRQAVTGQLVSPPLFESMEVMGKATSLQRLAEAQARLAAG